MGESTRGVHSGTRTSEMTVIFCRSREAVGTNDPEKRSGAEEKSRKRSPKHQPKEQKVFGDEIVRILPWDPFEESLEESLHQVSASISQIGNRPVDSGKSQHDREKREENSAKN